jgi:tetratricopeptide (TPR) repeat protein
MKRKHFYLLFVLFFLAITGFIVVKYHKGKRAEQSAFYTLLDRKGELAKAPEWASVRTNAEHLIKTVRLNPNDSKASLALAALFLQEARATGNYAYYDKAALKYVEDVLKNEPGNFQALLFKAILLISQHHFSEGLAVAEQAQKINPYNAFVYGILVDSHVELGNYKAAVENADKMISIRPDMRSYSRIAYLREIHGDYPGAIEAMQMAVESGVPGDEGTEWCRIQLGKLYEKTGEVEKAKLLYQIALQNRPSYPYALAGLARITAFSKNYRQAEKYYQEANSLINDYGFRAELADVYSLMNMPQKASTIRNELIKDMLTESSQTTENGTHGHYSDGELAMVYVKEKEYEKALQHALLEYNRRPGNIDINETLAWVYYKKGDVVNANQHITEALKTGSKNPTLLCHAGLIVAKAGANTKAKTLLTQGLHNNAYLEAGLKTESLHVLATLN